MKRYVFFFLCIYGNCLLGRVSAECAQQQDNPSQVWMTVFVHGTVGLKYNLDLPTFIHLMSDSVEETHYQRVVGAIRHNSFFYKAQAMQDIGLHAIDTKSSCDGHAAGACAHLFDKLLSATHAPDAQIKNLYYTYGWSGLLSTKMRYQESAELYRLLVREQALVQKKHPKCVVQLRLIGFSHGGSICLNLAAVRQQEAEKQEAQELIIDNKDNKKAEHTPELSIDELILLGMPVQTETDYLVCDHIFKQIYHFYSRNDFIQKMDCFSFKRWFSRRRFYDSTRYTVPDNLTQIEVKVKSTVFQGCRKRRIDRSPYHSEFWYFGWIPLSYRPTFSLYPLPVVIFVPSMIGLVKEHAPQANHVVLELLPDEGKASIRRRFAFSKKWVDWLAPDAIAQLKECAGGYQPADYSYALYETHAHNALYAVHNGDVGKPRKKRLRRMHHTYHIPQC